MKPTSPQSRRQNRKVLKRCEPFRVLDLEVRTVCVQAIVQIRGIHLARYYVGSYSSVLDPDAIRDVGQVIHDMLDGRGLRLGQEPRIDMHADDSAGLPDRIDDGIRKVARQVQERRAPPGLPE